MFRGREQSRPDLGYRLLQRLAGDVEELGFVEAQPKQDGRNMIMVIGPHKRKPDGKADRVERIDRSERVERPEPIERPERVERPERAAPRPGPRTTSAPGVPGAPARPVPSPRGIRANGPNPAVAAAGSAESTADAPTAT
jgi:translation initiation factor IF-3